MKAKKSNWIIGLGRALQHKLKRMVFAFREQIGAVEGTERTAPFLEEFRYGPEATLWVSTLYLEKSPTRGCLKCNILDMLRNYRDNVVFE
ncbi:MAG: hypothetical protein OXE86_18520 [Alphaproteobacteria bacterium]|nr:hypothetical protein [Alphaproteobacteria bacterium]